MDSAAITRGLNDAQRSAVEAVTGPVCILAGAGAGKTTTITHRIANQVASGAFEASSILAVTFTDKAAGEMRARLTGLAARGVRARTFHSAALAQLRHLAADPPGQILPSKAAALRQLGNALPKPYRFRPAGDLATEVEWARNRRITPERYMGSLGSHEPPIPADLMQSIFGRYEKGKRERGLIDFEDVLELAIRMFDKDEYARERFSARYRAFTVDEYQDVNVLQETLLARWLGGRDELCVVGDDYQSIYAFTGASPEHLLTMPRRYPGTTIVRLDRNYRSSPQVLGLANRLVPMLGGAEKVLVAAREDGPNPICKAFLDEPGESRWLVEEVRRLQADEGVAYENMAVLYRANWRSEDYEEAFAGAGVPFQVRGGVFLARPAARRLLARLQRSRSSDVAAEVAGAARREGFTEQVPDGVGEQEATRQRDLARLIELAQEFDDGIRSLGEFVEDLRQRFGSDGEGRGVNLLTLHRAKGLEFDAVFLPRMQDGELPFKRAKDEDAIAEERRLLYVGITRARVHLALTWTTGGRARPSPFLDELGVRGYQKTARSARAETVIDDPVLTRLKQWRLERARSDGVPAYVILHDRSLAIIAGQRPSSTAELASVPGIGPAKLERYGQDIIAALGGAEGGAGEV